MSNLSINSSLQTLPVSDSVARPKTQAAAASQAATESSLGADILQLQKQSRDRDIKNAVVGIATIGGMIGGAGTMLMSKSTPGMLIGAGIMGAGLLSGRIAEGKNIGSGAVAYLGAGASIGVGAAVSYATKNVWAGAAVTGLAIVGTLALSRSLQEK